MGIWTNNDGLTLKYGPTKTIPATLGEYRHDGALNCIEIVLDQTQMPLVTANSVVIDKEMILPIGSIIERIEMTNKTAFTSGGAATVNIGLVNLDGVTAADPDAIVVEATLTELNDGGTNIAGWIGAELLGAPTTVAKLFTWEVNTADLTAGFGVVRIYFSRP